VELASLVTIGRFGDTGFCRGPPISQPIFDLASVDGSILGLLVSCSRLRFGEGLQPLPPIQTDVVVFEMVHMLVVERFHLSVVLVALLLW
jgi:hypothetical protein